MGLCVAWVKFLRELCGLRGLNIFYVGHNFSWVAWIKYIFAWVKIFCLGQFSYLGQHFLRGSKFLGGSIFGG